MNEPRVIKCPVQFGRSGRGGQKRLRTGPLNEGVGLALKRALRVSRLLALALRLAELVRSGTVGSYRELALLGHVTPARISQIMNLIYLAPAIQEEILFMTADQGRDPIPLQRLLPITRKLDWQIQWCLWTAVKNKR